ncbi:KICSTOR complex protein SZT2 [Oncorhynchus keta]|uniref:KICSTOR complex protein SZT2 n=1 Tax=Oncorhynchus keta TaxID=8018 RepID=UPI0015F9842E|nr:KICSTOR complex protein SZT2 [Oncorhynchus keta]
MLERFLEEVQEALSEPLSMLFREECDKVIVLMHVHSFSYDLHLRVVHQSLVGCHMTLQQGYRLTSFLEDFIAHHPDIPKFRRNHVFQGLFLDHESQLVPESDQSAAADTLTRVAFSIWLS